MGEEPHRLHGRGPSDWCISRQRSWGVPIPVFKCAKCGETVATEETFDAVIELFRTEGADAWFTRDPKDYLPRNTKCERCGCADVVPEKDILDVWWESGVSHTSVCKHRSAEGLHFPADLYLEGSDQHRGWFQSSLLTSIGAYGVPPYKSVMHCGFTVDEEGRKMSKSLGNGIDPAEVMDKFGADVLRLWVASVDYSQDVSISDSILKQVSDAYRRFRNTFRFLLGNLNDFDFERDGVAEWDALEPVDKHMMIKLADVLAEIEAAYASYKFNSVYRIAYDFVNELSAVYMDVTKDRLYSEAPDSPRRRAVQTVLMNILEVLVRVMSPILSFTCDEVWEHYPQSERSKQGRPFSVQLCGLGPPSTTLCLRWSAKTLPWRRSTRSFARASSSPRLSRTRAAPSRSTRARRLASSFTLSRRSAARRRRSMRACSRSSSSSRVLSSWILPRAKTSASRFCRRGREVPALLELPRAGRQRRASGCLQALRRRLDAIGFVEA